MTVPGFAGHVLYVDLTRGKTRKEPLDDRFVHAFIGGYGINTRLLYDVVSPAVDPLSPDNPIILGAGPFAGTIVPGSAELIGTTKFPVNGAFASACGGGHFALMLKTCGKKFWSIFRRDRPRGYAKEMDPPAFYPCCIGFGIRVVQFSFHSPGGDVGKSVSEYR